MLYSYLVDMLSQIVQEQCIMELPGKAAKYVIAIGMDSPLLSP